MRLLLDTNAVLAMAHRPEHISESTRRILLEPSNELHYSITALWEIAIKNGTRRSLGIDPVVFRDLLQEAGFQELPITASHVLAVNRLPRVHGDPFDRVLIAQAIMEGMTLTTSDRIMLAYPGVLTLPL